MGMNRPLTFSTLGIKGTARMSTGTAVSQEICHADLNERLTNLARVEGNLPGGGACNLLMEAVERITSLEATLHDVVSIASGSIDHGHKIR